jgi:hypothetical protein
LDSKPLTGQANNKRLWWGRYTRSAVPFLALPQLWLGAPYPLPAYLICFLPISAVNSLVYLLRPLRLGFGQCTGVTSWTRRSALHDSSGLHENVLLHYWHEQGAVFKSTRLRTRNCGIAFGRLPHPDTGTGVWERL